MKRYVFVGCESLDTIYCMGTRPPGVLYNGEQLFPETVCENSILFVPESALGAYRNRWPWSAFANIQTFEPSGISEVDADKDIYAPMEIYTPGGVYVGDKLDVLSPGFYIVRQGITSRKVVVR